MTKEQLLLILKENESLKLKVQRLEQSTDRLQSRYYDAENELNTFKKKYDFLNDQFKEIVRQCFPREFIDNKMRSYTETQLYDFLIEKIRILEQGVFDKTQENIKMIESLKETAEELERFKNAGPMFIENNYENNQNNDYENDDSENNETRNISQAQEKTTIGNNAVSLDKPQETDDNANPIYGVMTLIEEKDWSIIKTVGEGETLFTNIATRVGLGNATVNDILNSLQQKGIINFEKVAKGGKGRPAHHYFLTPLGVKVYELKFQTTPTTTMLEKLSTHGSPAHGGLMLEVGEFLTENGCEVFYDGVDTTFKLKDNREIKFDIKAFDPQTKEVLFFETERGKCGDKHLQEKFDKCYLFTKLGLTKTIHIIAPDKQALHEIQQQLFRWVRKNQTELQMLQKNNADKAMIIFKTATLEDLRSGKLYEFFYGIK